MTMHSDSVLYCRLDKLLLPIGRNRDGAVHFTRVITAIYKQSSHLESPAHNDSERPPLPSPKDHSRAGSRPIRTLAQHLLYIRYALFLALARCALIGNLRLSPAT